MIVSQTVTGNVMTIERRGQSALHPVIMVAVHDGNSEVRLFLAGLSPDAMDVLIRAGRELDQLNAVRDAESLNRTPRLEPVS